MPGGRGCDPATCFTARNGKTIEVLNTDAEGRLILADGLALAAEEEPDLSSTSPRSPGRAGSPSATGWPGYSPTRCRGRSRQGGGGPAGERFWGMPLVDDYRSVESEVADMKNTGDRYGGAIAAALILGHFVGAPLGASRRRRTGSVGIRRALPHEGRYRLRGAHPGGAGGADRRAVDRRRLSP